MIKTDKLVQQVGKLYRKYSIVIVVLVTVVSCSGVDSAPEKIELDIQDIAERNHHIATIESGTGFEGQILIIVPDSEEQRITVWEEGDPGE